MHTKTFISVFLLLVCISTCFSQESGKSEDPAEKEKLDSLLEIQKNTAEQISELKTVTEKIYKEQKNEPLEGKTMGIEINPLWLLFLNEGIQITGGVSLFDVHRKAEIAFPIVYREFKDSDAKSFFLASHYRHFLGNTQNGFYLSGLGEFNYLKYNAVTIDTSFNAITTTRTTNRAGIGFGFGYRKFSYGGLYWGFSMSIGRYIWKSEEFEDLSVEGIFSAITGDLLFDVEFFKFGWAF